jgi:SAM-dependent methyltransferase
VYPLLRGACGLTAAFWLPGRFTEAGQSDRLAWVLEELAGAPPQRILDAGCGAGAYTTALARLGHHVTALDFSTPMLNATAATAAAMGIADRVRVVQGDLRVWEPEQSFDTVICMGVLEYYPGAEGILERLFTWTRGRLLLSLSGAGPGWRVLARRAWLKCHGVQAHFYRASEMERLLGRLPRAAVRVREMRWAHCASATRASVFPHPLTNGDGTSIPREDLSCLAS